MKLKKIASLALAGVMAVSMLAGCEGKGTNNNGGNSTTEEPVVSTTPVVDAVNKGQSASNDVKINFTTNASMDAALKKAVSVYGNDATEAEVKAAINRITGLKSVGANDTGDNDKDIKKNQNCLQDGDWEGFLRDGLKYDIVNGKDQDQKDKVWTVFGVEKIEGVYTEEAALNKVAEGADDAIEKLDAHSNTTDTAATEKYYTYSYDGSIGMVSVKTLDGTTDYYVAYVVNQTVSEATMK